MYLVDPHAVEWADFRAHSPTCADCAAEMAAWTALQERLGTAGHRDPEVLLRWADGDDVLPAADRLALARHVESCRTCTRRAARAGAVRLVAVPTTIQQTFQ